MDQSLLHQVAGRADAVVDVDHAPVAVEPLPVRTPVTRRTSVVHIDECEAAARPVLVLERIRRTAPAGRTAVAVDDERRLPAPGRREVLGARPGVRSVARQPGFAGENT